MQQRHQLAHLTGHIRQGRQRGWWNIDFRPPFQQSLAIVREMDWRFLNSRSENFRGERMR